MKNYAIGYKKETIGALTALSPFADWIVLCKPGIVGLVLVAAFAGMFVGGVTGLDALHVVFGLIGLGGATAGAAMLNNYIDRDIDGLMERTSGRALARGAVSAEKVLIAGYVLVFLSLVLLYEFVNVAAALTTAAGVFGYVILYTLILKRRSAWANQVGGLAGAMPPVIGYAAATGTVDMTAAILFLIVALWQQPHAISLAMIYREQYKKAGIPVIPVAKGIAASKTRIFVYTAFLGAASALPYVIGMAGAFYMVSAMFLGAAFVLMSVLFLFSKKEKSPLVFAFSIVYLSVLFAALLADLV
ncbi:MAG: heme o synthase [Deltaproteobacteria bacterium]|nr:heme o synthase [Deltaproteobacteria bacterium]